MVGSVPEFLQHGKNGYLYRYDEAETLAFYIDRLFSDEALAAQLGAAGRETVRQMFPQEKIGQQLMDAYCAMINK
jgi:glycosyltransferase involved in cell wall biosynthesis